MRLSAVVGQDMTIPPEWDRDVQHIRIDSRDVATGDLFIARKGSAGHGADYISQAIAQGAVAVLEEGLAGRRRLRCGIGQAPSGRRRRRPHDRGRGGARDPR